MPDPNSRPLTGNTSLCGRAVRCQPEREGSRVQADKTVGREGGGVDPNREVRGKATGVRSRFFNHADRTGQNS